MSDEQQKNETEQHSPVCDCEQLKKEVAEYKTGWQRAVADYQNLQKEVKERRQEWVEMSEQQVLEEFIPVYDNFKKAFASKEQGTLYQNGTGQAWNKSGPQRDPARAGEQENWVMGIGYIMKQFGDILKAHKVEEIKTVGEQFDPTRHESVGEEECEKEPGVIVREVEGGYSMSGRVIKVARVIISKSK